MKSPCASKITKSSEKTVFNNLRELYDNAKIKAKEKVKEPKSSTSFAVSVKTSSCASENQLTSFSSEKEEFIVSALKVSNILRKSNDSSRNPHKTPSALNLELEHNINPLSHSLKDTSLPVQKESSPVSSKIEKKLDPVRNLTDDLNASGEIFFAHTHAYIYTE